MYLLKHLPDWLSTRLTAGFRSTVPAAFVLGTLLIAGCARIGNPSGGPRDEDPPIFVSANPAPGSMKVDKTKISILFNEIVNVKDAFTKVVVSPPEKSIPRVTSQGKRVTVDFDSLSPNTTYTVDFADAIEDNNEGNKLTGFTYTFSTGDNIDTLRLSGRVLEARTLEPQQGILVGIHSDMADSAFTSKRFLRVAKTDDRGQFTIRGVAPGTYRVYALEDKDNDYAYANPEENLAFLEYTVSPSTETAEAHDSIYNVKTGQLDTVVTRQRTRFLPNDILLRTFNSGKRPQYLSKNERTDSARVFLKFNAPSKQLPKVSVVDRPDILSIGIPEVSPALDSIVYWLTPDLAAMDSLRLSVEYLRTDSTGALSPQTDTLRLFNLKNIQAKKKAEKHKNAVKKLTEKDAERAAKDSLDRLLFSFTAGGGTQNVNEPLRIEVPVPLTHLDTAAFRLEVMVDSTWLPAPDPFVVIPRDSLSPRHFLADYPWAYDTRYRLSADSLIATNLYGQVSKPLAAEFSTKKADDYSSLTLRLKDMPPGPAFVELLNSSDAVVRTAVVENGTVSFPFLEAGKYYARMIADANGNGIYDTGSFEDNRQPEFGYYYPKIINIKKNWNREETWDVLELPMDMQKPKALIKNKPQADSRRRTDTSSDEEEEEEPFDVNSNPFDPNRKTRVKTGQY